MKQVNVLMEDDLFEHLRKFSQLLSFTDNEKITVSEVVRRAVAEYSNYKKMNIQSQVLDGGRITINVFPHGETSHIMTNMK